MANIFRIINCMRNDEETSNTLTTIGKKYPDSFLASTAPIPNQAFRTRHNDEGKDCVLYISNYASKIIDKIRKLSERQSTFRANKNKSDRQIEFIALGYVDFNNDIVINDIMCPMLDDYNAAKNPEVLFSKPYSKSYTESITDAFSEYLDTKKVISIGSAPIALLGFTKPAQPENNIDTCNCFSLAELAKATHRNTSVNNQIATGVLSITSDTFSHIPKKSKLGESMESKRIIGSLECMIIDYNINPNNECPQPKAVTNITKCMTIGPNQELIPCKISKSDQPLNGIHICDEHKFIKE